MIAFLPCPECSEPAIPASGYDRTAASMEPTWSEDDEATCPGCGRHLGANLTGDGESEWMEAVIVPAEDAADA